MPSRRKTWAWQLSAATCAARQWLSARGSGALRTAAAAQTLFGGDILVYTNLCERTRTDSYRMMCEHAEANGANAIVAMRYDANEILSGVTEVICYGAAVFAEPER